MAESDKVRRNVVVSYVALFLMNVLDWYYTGNALMVGGDEGNPLMKWILVNYGLNGILAVKLIVLAFLGWFLPALFDSKFVRHFFYLAGFAYTGLTLYHIWWYYYTSVAYDSLVL